MYPDTIMAGLVEYIYVRMKNYLSIVLYGFIFLLFVLAGYYAYSKYYLPDQKNKDFTDVANKGDRVSIADIYFFYADWCPHCQTAKPEWQKFKRDFNQQSVNGTTINCIEVNCTDDKGTLAVPGYRDATPVAIADILANFGVDSYPTIKMTKDGNTFDFDAKVTEDNLKQFVNSVL